MIVMVIYGLHSMKNAEKSRQFHNNTGKGTMSSVVYEKAAGFVNKVFILV